MTLAAVILCNCPLIEGIQNQSSSLRVLMYNFFIHDLHSCQGGESFRSETAIVIAMGRSKE